MSQPQSLLSAVFNRANPEQFWHFLMKTRKNEEIYQSDKVEARIQQIIKKKGSNSFTFQSDNGWTPAHVAVLSGNEAGLRFLKSREALAVDVKDNNGATPLDYARMYQPNLVKLFEEFPSCLKTILPKWEVSLPKIPFCYHAYSNDFGVEIKSLLFASQVTSLKQPLQIEYSIENLKLLSEKFGFELILSDHPYCVRDNLIRLPNGIVMLGGHSEHIMTAVDRNISHALIFRDHAKFLTDHCSFKGHSGASEMQRAKGTVDIVTHFELNSKGELPVSRVYMEGGNHYSLTNRFGQRMIIFGKDTLHIAVNHMRLDGAFNDPSFKMSEGIEKKKALLSKDPSLLKRTLEEMHAQGLIKPGKEKGKGLLSKKEVDLIKAIVDGDIDTPYQVEGNPYLDEAIKETMFSPLVIQPSQMQNGIVIAAEYLAQIDIVQRLMAANFKVSFDNIVFVPQLAYHLDVFLRPGPNGSLFMQDYAFTAELLREIEKNSEILNFSAGDKEMLRRYLETAEKFAWEFGPSFLKAKELLTAAGFILIPTPGLFYDVSPALLPDHISTSHLNFLNAITGWSLKANSYFYIASGASVGDKLGGMLMKSFEEMIKYYQPNTEVCFVGYDPKNPTDFSESMRWMNHPELLLGPHCLSFEKETANHNG